MTQRNLNFPRLRNLFRVRSPGLIAVFFLQFPPYAVTVCVLDVGFFHTMRSPLPITRLTGRHFHPSCSDPAALIRDVSPADGTASIDSNSATVTAAINAVRLPMNPSVLRLALLLLIRWMDRVGLPKSAGERETYYPMWSLSDEALLAGMRSGDPEAAAGFVRRYQSRVFGLVFTVLGNRAVAEEAAQETFLKAWRNADAYDPRRGRVSTWLLSIARNTAVDVARLKRAEPLDPHELVLLCERHDDSDPDDPFIAAVELHRLRRAIRDLPEEQKVALL